MENEGRTDRIIRAILGIGLLAGSVFFTGWVFWIFILAGSALLFTALTGFCLLYKLLGLRTNVR
ncbi:MAG: YgaP family membrane protein [Nanoarchaeota archaeon]